MKHTENLITDESVVFESKKHWIAPVRDSWKAAGLILIAYLIGWITPDNSEGFLGSIWRLLDLIRTALFLVGVGWIIYNIVVWATAEFTVTNLRVLGEEGLISKRSSSTLLQAITDVKSRVGFLGKTLGYGDVLVITQSGESGADRLMTITKPLEFRTHVLDAKMADRKGAAAAAVAAAAPAMAAAAIPAAAANLAAATPAPAPPAPDPAATLAQLADLRDKGVITPEEYEAKKQEVLARM